MIIKKHNIVIVDHLNYYITHVSMKSLMLNQKNSTYVKFYLLVHKTIYKEQKIVIDKICQQHTNCVCENIHSFDTVSRDLQLYKYIL